MNGVCKKHRLRAAAEHIACLVILSLVVALVIVGPGTGEMEEEKKSMIEQAISWKAHVVAVRMMGLLSADQM